MITEAVILSIVTIIGGGILAMGKSYIEGKAQADIEEIKSRAEDLEEKLEDAETENQELKSEIKALEKDIVSLEAKLETWKRRYWIVRVDSEELKLVFYRVMRKADIPTDQFEALVKRIKEDGYQEDCQSGD